MRVVITGASGFLGRALSRRLADDGIDVVAVTRRQLPGFTHVEGYAESPSGDVLVHLAEASDRRWANEQGAAYETAALDVVRRLLGNNYSRFVYASSAVLYGDQQRTPRRVTSPVHVVDTYTRIKRGAEQAVLDVNGTVARLTNVFGPGMSEANVLSSVLRQLPAPGAISLRDVTHVRDFVWVDDAAEALHAMVLAKPTGTFNVGTGIGTSIGELARTLLNRAGQSERPIEAQQRSTSLSHLVVDIEETRAALGWRPRTTVPAGIDLLLRNRTLNG